MRYLEYEIGELKPCKYLNGIMLREAKSIYDKYKSLYFPFFINDSDMKKTIDSFNDGYTKGAGSVYKGFNSSDYCLDFKNKKVVKKEL